MREPNVAYSAHTSGSTGPHCPTLISSANSGSPDCRSAST